MKNTSNRKCIKRPFICSPTVSLSLNCVVSLKPEEVPEADILRKWHTFFSLNCGKEKY